MPEDQPKWSLTNLPPEGHKDVGKFVFDHYQISLREKQRLLIPDRCMANHKLYRGDHWGVKKIKGNRNKLTVNLFFANVNRTVANLTARNPEAEVVDLDGIKDEADVVQTAKLRKWWRDTNQKSKLISSCLNMEIYGITIEKMVGDLTYTNPNIVVVDSYGFVPWPGVYDDFSKDCPAIFFLSAEPVFAVENQFGVKDVEGEQVYELLGKKREEHKRITTGYDGSGLDYTGTMTPVANPTDKHVEISQQKCLMVEGWFRDYSTKEIEVETGQELVDENTGEVIMETVKEKVPKYPGGIRVITITRGKGDDAKDGFIVLDDKPNPNINPGLNPEVAAKTYLWDRFPCWIATSYEDTSSLWGFSAAEQTADLNYKIDEIFSRMAAYILRCMFPILVVPDDCGIKKEMLNTKPNLVLMTSRPVQQGSIYFVQPPNLPRDFFNMLNLFVSFFDRVYQIEDADRGVGPKGVVAASAIVALQERNAALIQHKRKSTEFLVEQRGKCADSFFMNFGTQTESLNVKDEQVTYRGVEFAGRNFNYVVESGSTMPRTQLQTQELAMQLAEMNRIDTRTLLEMLNVPDWKRIVERTGENQLDMALNILIQAGMPQDQAMALKQMLVMPQGGPGDAQQSSGATPGVPKASQGAKPPSGVSPQKKLNSSKA